MTVKLSKSTIVVIAVAVIAAVAYVVRPDPNQGGTGPPIVQVRMPTLSAAAQAGEKLFNANCASCHGTNAAGQYGVAPPLVHKIYAPSHHANGSFQRTMKYSVRSHHWRFRNMPPVKRISPSEVAKLAVYVRELQRANDIS